MNYFHNGKEVIKCNHTPPNCTFIGDEKNLVKFCNNLMKTNSTLTKTNAAILDFIRESDKPQLEFVINKLLIS